MATDKQKRDTIKTKVTQFFSDIEKPNGDLKALTAAQLGTAMPAKKVKP
jgi:hypothetical protein